MADKFQTKKFRIRELLLDAKNPRFVDLADTSQSGIIAYLLKNEEVIELARSISAYGGLMPGEFPLVCIEDDNKIVVEGNRRLCALKVLLSPNLAPTEYRASVPVLAKNARTELNRIQVHVIGSREQAQIVLGTRHITGVKTWPSISKFIFFANHFESGKTIEQIELLTGVKRSQVTAALKKHYFLQYILSLDCWSEVEKQNLINYTSLHRIGVDRILRIFQTEGASKLKLSYNTQFKPVSELPQFGKIVEYIVRRSLNLLPDKDPLSTRNTFSDIEDDVKEWIPEVIEKPVQGDKSTELPLTSEMLRDNPIVSGTKDIPPTALDVAPTTPATLKNKTLRQTDFYFENLTYIFTPVTDQDKALVGICEEIKKISRGSAYRQYPLATSFITRALIEQACKRYLRINDSVAFGKLCPVNKDSSLTLILRHFCNSPDLFADKNYHRVFVGLFPNGEGIKGLMDLNMHHPGLSMPTGTVLEGWVSSGLKNLLEYLLK